MRRWLTLMSAAGALIVLGCQAPRDRTAVDEAGRRGTLLLIGGGLDDDSRFVWERFVALAKTNGPARVVIATAATGPQDQEATDKTEALRTWAPEVPVEVVRRETATAATVAAIDRATALFFTGGDQKRITERYRPGDGETPEWVAMQRLLARGGVIAGASAGLAMMGEVMFLTGGSATALGIAPKSGPGGNGEVPKLGPQQGPGMRLLPWAITDSHFFERDRLGRLVAGLEASGRRLGIGVGEDACVEVDLATSELVGITVSESLLVDATHLRRDGLTRTGLVARVIRKGDRLCLREWLEPREPPPIVPAGPLHDVPIAEPGQNRQLASWRLFRQASVPASGALRLRLEAWNVTAFPIANGNIGFEVRAND